MSEAEPHCAFVPFGRYHCDRPGLRDGYCFEHANTHCVVCGQRATHHCLGTVGSWYCAADVCDDCDNYKAGYVHDCGRTQKASITLVDRAAREAAEKPIREARAAEAAAARAAIEEAEYAISSDPKNWTVGFLAGHSAMLWARCEACNTGLLLSNGAALRGRAEQWAGDLKVACHACHQPGAVVAEWLIGNGQRCTYNFATQEQKGRWPRHSSATLSWPLGA